MELGLNGKIAIVAGGSKGLGAASANGLAAEGAKLFLTSRNEDQLAETARRLKNDHGADAEIFPADLIDPAAANAIAEAAIERFGRIDILINSAGASQGGVFWEISDEVWEESFALKVMGTIRLMRAVVPKMRERKYGRIVTIAGSSGHQPSPRILPAAAANAALLAVTTGLAHELAADGIVIVAVNPGPTRTGRWNTLMKNLADQGGVSVEEVEAGFIDQVPMARLAAPEEIARIVTFLASDAAANMTGTSVTADGGWTRALA
ncbi:MAG: SDR family oxidoreductase [Alphaproteobacteria bacterium]|nr:SDR family oxidoreductase [Alphaproteobacteria bacterium]